MTIENLLPAALVVECFMLFLFRCTHSPFTGVMINEWYTRFRWTAFLMDVASFLIGALLAVLVLRCLKVKITPLKFLGVALLVQIAHDVLFYLVVVRSAGQGNEIVALMQRYASSAGVGAIAGDSFMYVLMAVVLVCLPKMSPEAYALATLLPLYVSGYLLYQKPLL